MSWQTGGTEDARRPQDIGVAVRLEPVEPREGTRLVGLVLALEHCRTAVLVLKHAQVEARTWIARFVQDDCDFVIVVLPADPDQEPSTD